MNLCHYCDRRPADITHDDGIRLCLPCARLCWAWAAPKRRRLARAGEATTAQQGALL